MVKPKDTQFKLWAADLHRTGHEVRRNWAFTTH